MNALTNLFALDRIALNSPCKNRAEAFAAAGQLFAKQAGLEAEATVGFLNAREDLGSTALGAGVAIPHGRVKGLKQPIAAFVKLKEPIEFAAPDGEAVSILIFLLVMPRSTHGSNCPFVLFWCIGRKIERLPEMPNQRCCSLSAL